MSQQINLFNPIFLKQKKSFSSVKLVQALGLILAVIFLLFVYLKFQSSRLAQEAAQTTAQMTETQQQLDKAIVQYVPRKGNQALADELKAAQDEQAGIQQAMAKLQNDEFGNKKGYSAYMRGFSNQIIDGLWLTGFSIVGAGNAIGIQGRAMQPDLVPTFISRLKQETILQGKSFAVLEMQQPKPEPKTAQTVDKPNLPPPFIEFDLRTSGMEQALPKPASAVDAAEKFIAQLPTPAPITAPVPSVTAASQPVATSGVSAP